MQHPRTIWCATALPSAHWQSAFPGGSRHGFPATSPLFPARNREGTFKREHQFLPPGEEGNWCSRRTHLAGGCRWQQARLHVPRFTARRIDTPLPIRGWGFGGGRWQSAQSLARRRGGSRQPSTILRGRSGEMREKTATRSPFPQPLSIPFPLAGHCRGRAAWRELPRPTACPMLRLPGSRHAGCSC